MRKQTEKTGGNGKVFLVDDPDYMNLDGDYRKKKNKPTNITLKKKKRKKTRRTN